MTIASRAGVTGICALAVLSAVHWLRDEVGGWEASAVVYALGVLPNLTAAVAIPYVLLGIWADQTKAADPAAAFRMLVGLSAVGATGLLAWELVQRRSSTLVFDLHDVAATVVGAASAVALGRLAVAHQPRR